MRLNNHLSMQSLQKNEKPLSEKSYTHHNERQHQLSKVEEQATPLIATPPEQHPYHPNTDNMYL